MDEVTWGHMGEDSVRGERKREKRGTGGEKLKKKCVRGRELDTESGFKMDASSCSKPQRKRGKVTTILLNYTSPSG